MVALSPGAGSRHDVTAQLTRGLWRTAAFVAGFVGFVAVGGWIAG